MKKRMVTKMRKFWNALVRSLEKSAQARAAHQLRQMGYTPERLAEMTNENLNRWV